MVLLEVWLDTAVREGFERGCSLDEIAHETGLTVPEVVEWEKDLHLISQSAADRILRTLPPDAQM